MDIILPAGKRVELRFLVVRGGGIVSLSTPLRLVECNVRLWEGWRAARETASCQRAPPQAHLSRRRDKPPPSTQVC